MNHTINELCLQCNDTTGCKSCTGVGESDCTICKTDYYLTDAFGCVNETTCTNG